MLYLHVRNSKKNRVLLSLCRKIFVVNTGRCTLTPAGFALFAVSSPAPSVPSPPGKLFWGGVLLCSEKTAMGFVRLQLDKSWGFHLLPSKICIEFPAVWSGAWHRAGGR
eukprot:RCo003229